MSCVVRLAASSFLAAGAACSTPEPATVALRDELAIVADPGGKVRVDVLDNDRDRGPLAIDAASSFEAGVTVQVTSDGRLELDASDGWTGVAEISYQASLGSSELGDGTLTLYVDAYFADLYAALEREVAGQRMIDAYDEDAVAPLEPNLVLELRLRDRAILRHVWGTFDPATTAQPIASASKWVAAVLALHARDESAVGLDDVFTDHLPGFVNPALDGAGPQRGAITLRQAFSMSHGLASGHRYQTMRPLDLVASVEAIRAGIPVTGTCIPGLTCGPVPMAFVPGTHVGYDGKGFQVAGRAILAAYVGAHPDWRSLARDELFAPCGMTTTTYDAFYPENSAVAGGVVTTADDYLRMLDMIHAGGSCGDTPILSAASLDDLFAWHLTPDGGLAPRDTPIWESPWPNCSGTRWAGGGPPIDCSTWPDGTPTGGSYFEPGITSLRYGFGSWVLAESDGQPSWLTSPGAFGTAPFFDRTLDARGILFTYVAAAVTEGGTVPEYAVVNLYILRSLRAHLDALVGGSGLDLAPTEDVP